MMGFTGFVMFVMMWWIIFLAILPFGGTKAQHHQHGHARSAPERPYLLVKITVTTVITLIVFAVVYLLIDANVIELDNMP